MANETTVRPLIINATSQTAPWVKLAISQAISVTEEYSADAKTYELEHIFGDVVDSAIKNELCLVSADNKSKTMLGACFAEYDAGIFWLSWVVTHRHYRNQGIGIDLVTAMCDKLRIEARATKIHCSSISTNIASAKMLERCGFTKIVELKKHWHGLDYFLWERFL